MKVKFFSSAGFPLEKMEKEINAFLQTGIVVKHIKQSHDALLYITIWYEDAEKDAPALRDNCESKNPAFDVG